MIGTHHTQATSTRALVDQKLDDYFAEQGARAMLHDEHFREMWDHLRLLARGGKRVRPLMLIAAHDHLGGLRREEAIRAAVGVELLHTALVVHDDIIDGDIERRGLPTIGALFAENARTRGLDDTAAQSWGTTMALLAGDLLLSGAVREVARIDAPATVRDQMLRVLDEGVYLAASGEQSDVAYSLRLTEPDAQAIRTMMHRKTACYSFEVPLRIGAALAGAPEPLGYQLGEIGRSLGVLFQMQDDLLGTFGTPEATGKSASGDLREAKMTLLVSYATGTPEWDAVADLFGQPDLGEHEITALRTALETSGARRILEREIEREAARTENLIGGARVPSALDAELRRAVRATVDRNA